MAELNINWRVIKCERCGNCCPDFCRYKEKDGDLFRCSVHPTIVSEEEAMRLRGHGCHLVPLALFVDGHYCPPLVRIVEENSSIQVKPKRWGHGVVGIENYHEVMATLGSLRRE